MNVIVVMVLKVVVMAVQVSQTLPAQVVSKVVLIVIQNAMIDAIVIIVVIVQAAIVAINVQIAKLVTHNVIQIIKQSLCIVSHFQLGSFRDYQ